MLPLVGLLVVGFIESRDVCTTCLGYGYRWKTGEIHKNLREEFASAEKETLETGHKRL